MQVWIKDFSPANIPGKSQLIGVLEKRKLTVKKWTPGLSLEIGVITLNNNLIEEEVLCFIKTYAWQKGNRIIVINFHESALSRLHLLELFEAGAEYVFQFSQICNFPDCIAEKILRWRNITSIVQSGQIEDRIVGKSLLLKKVLQEIIEVSIYSSAPVLICGERGTGKEMIARMVHEFCGRKEKGNFVVVDCTTLKKELAGSELFGHEKGSFTGADYAREGAFALANNGTLFLDEIGELPLNLQSELLRIIQEGTYKKTGSNIWKQTTFRLVAATNKDLELESEQENFRKDLYDRISVYKCTLPPLHQRSEDIPDLLKFFFLQHYPEVPEIDKTVVDFLCERKYPGNIRELKNIISRICLRYAGSGPVTLGDLIWYDKPINFEKKEQWFERKEFVAGIRQAIEEGYDMKKIEDIIKDISMQTALSIHGKNSLVSEALGVSDRWVQQRRARGVWSRESGVGSHES